MAYIPNVTYDGNKDDLFKISYQDLRRIMRNLVSLGLATDAGFRIEMRHLNGDIRSDYISIDSVETKDYEDEFTPYRVWTFSTRDDVINEVFCENLMQYLCAQLSAWNKSYLSGSIKRDDENGYEVEIEHFLGSSMVSVSSSNLTLFGVAVLMVNCLSSIVMLNSFSEDTK